MNARIRNRIRNGLVWLGGTFGNRVRGKRAIAFHDVQDPARFRDRLDWLLKRYDILSVDDWMARSPSGRTQLLLTFDDGYASWHELIAQILEERAVPALFFVSSGLVGLRGEDAEEFARKRLRRTSQLRFISRLQLRRLADNPLFDIGGHTVSHPDLGKVHNAATVRREIADDRAALENWIGAPVRWFAYPFGRPENVPALARIVVEDLQFLGGFTLIPGWWNPDFGDRYAIGRDGLDPAYSHRVWRAWLSGGYERMYALRRALAHGPRSA